jgi:hypothetical protein
MPPTAATADEIADAITESLLTLPGRLGRGRSNHEWTTQLKEDIGALGEAHGWHVCTSGFSGRFGCEWLYDLVWYREDAAGRMSEVHLVLESEWQEDHAAIKHDFEKLLLAKAPLKVMVFETNNLHMDILLSSMEQGIRAFTPHSAGEWYIIAAFNAHTYKFEIRRFNGA